MQTPSVPDYQRVVDSITEKITSGDLLPGAELPSYNDLHIEYDVSVSTVQRAMLVLRAQGLVEGRQGKGTYVVNRGASTDGSTGTSP
jgi:GntR family transcriptional regulator